MTGNHPRICFPQQTEPQLGVCFHLEASAPTPSALPFPTPLVCDSAGFQCHHKQLPPSGAPSGFSRAEAERAGPFVHPGWTRRRGRKVFAAQVLLREARSFPQRWERRWSRSEPPVKAAKRDGKMGHGATPARDTLRATQGPQQCLGTGAPPGLLEGEQGQQGTHTRLPKRSPALVKCKAPKSSAEHQPCQNHCQSPALQLYCGGESSDIFTCRCRRSSEMLPPPETCY